MLPAVVISIFFALIAVLAGAQVQPSISRENEKLTYAISAQDEVSAAVTSYYNEKFRFPTSLEVLASTVGYGQLRQYLSSSTSATGILSSHRNRVNLATSPAAINTTNPTLRNVFVYAYLRDDVADSSLLSSVANTCAVSGELANDFSNATQWCVAPTSAIAGLKTNSLLNTELEARVLAQQNKTLQKFKARVPSMIAYNASTAYSGTDNLYPTLPSTPFIYLSALQLMPLKMTSKANTTAIVGTAATCRGQFALYDSNLAYSQPVYLGCEDLYNLFGNPVSYIKLSNTSIQLTSTYNVVAGDNTTSKTLTSTLP